MSKFSDASHDILKTYFDVIKAPKTGTDNSYILGQNHTIVADGGVFTTLYQENDNNDMIAHNFRIIDIIGNSFKFKYEGIGSTHSAATVLEVDKAMFFRKDEKFRDWLVNNVDLYEDFVNTNKLFIYFGKIYPVADSTGQVGLHFNIQFEGMKNFVADALPDNNRNTNIEEFLSIYYDRVAHPIYNMTKQLWSFFDAKEVNLKHLDYLATREGISTDTDLIAELPLREFVDNLPYWMKRKSSYTSYYIIHKILLANSHNKLNIYEKWAEWCLRDLRGDKNYTLPSDYELHHIKQHYGALVSGGAGPEYYDQWNEIGDDYQSDLVLSPPETATDVLNDQNDIQGWRVRDVAIETSERESERWSLRVKFLEPTDTGGTPLSAHWTASEPFRMVQGHSYHFEYDAGAERAAGHLWSIIIETPRASGGTLPEERVYSKMSQKGYGRAEGEPELFNSFVTSGAFITPTVTADDYQIKLFATHHSYFDNVYLVKIPTPKTGFPRPYPVYSDAPTANCRANSWDFGDEIDMQIMTIYNDDGSDIVAKYNNIIQVDDYRPHNDITVGYPWLYPPDVTSAQSPSATGEYNISNIVNLDSFSKPSGGMLVWGMQNDYYQNILRASDSIDPNYNFLAVEYVLRHRDGNYTDISAQAGPARQFKIHEGWQGNLYSQTSSGDYYRADTNYYLGIHKFTHPYEKINVRGQHFQATNDIYSPAALNDSLFDGNTASAGYANILNTNSSDPGAYLYFDMGEGNGQPISMARFFRAGSTGTAPIWDIEASHDGFSTPSASINLYSDWQPSGGGWNKVAWPNSTQYRFFRLIMQNTPGVNSGYTELEFYKGEPENAELRLNIYDKERMKNPVDLIESVRLQLHDDSGYGGFTVPNRLWRPIGQVPASGDASLYYDIQDLKLSGGYTRSIAPTGNLILTPHYNVEIDLSSEPMGPVDEIITVGQADEIIRYWNYLKPVDKFVDHSFLISPIGKIDELHESVSLYNPLELGICDTRFIGVNTLSTTAAPANTNLVDNYLMDDTGYWLDYQFPVNNRRDELTFFSPSASRFLEVNDELTGFRSEFFNTELGFEYNYQFMIYPSAAYAGQGGNILVGVSDGNALTWMDNTHYQNLNVGKWNKIEGKWTETVGGPNSYISFQSFTGQPSGAWFIDDVLVTKGKLDIFSDTSVEKRTFATSEWPITHNLVDNGVMTQIYDPDDNILYPKRLEIVDGNRVRAYFNAGQRGRAFTAAVKEWGKVSNTHFFSTAASAWDVTHNLGTSGASGVCYQCYNEDLSSNIVPENVQVIDVNNLKVTFSESVAGYCFVRDDDFYHINTEAEETWRVTHNINARGLICHAYDHNGFRQYPETIEMEDYNTARIDWAEPVSGTACFLFFQRAFTEQDLLNSMGASGGLTDKVIGTGGTQHGFWKVGNGATLGFDPIIANDLDSVTTSGNIDDILVTSPSPSGSILFNFHVPRETERTITEMGIFDLDKNLQYYTKTGELHKPTDVQLDVRYRIRKFPTGV